MNEAFKIIKNNIEYWIWEPKVIWEAKNITAVGWNNNATITRTDPNDTVNVSFVKSVLVRNTSNIPVDINDWTIVVENSTRNQYSVNWYVDTWLINWTNYYYNVFVLWDNWLYSTWVWVMVTPALPPYLCFTAKQANSRIYLQKNGSPTTVTLEISTDWTNWSTYTIWNTINLVNVWDKVYFRNASTTTTWFSTSTSNYYKFAMGGRINGSWSVNYLLNKNWTTTLSNYCFAQLFQNCVPLATAPQLPSTTVTDYCYYNMFQNCTNLTTAPALPATNTWYYCYANMFYGCSALTNIPSLYATAYKNSCCYQMFFSCSKIKLSTTKTWEYQTSYRIPKSWTWTTETNALRYMFSYTWWTFADTPNINTTYYTSNALI